MPGTIAHAYQNTATWKCTETACLWFRAFPAVHGKRTYGVFNRIWQVPEPQEAFHITTGPKPEDLKIPEHWTDVLLMNVLQRGCDVSFTVIRDALEMLHAESSIVDVPGVPGGYELTPRSRIEAGLLGATPSWSDAIHALPEDCPSPECTFGNCAKRDSRAFISMAS
jgi:hypothetical protein